MSAGAISMGAWLAFGELAGPVLAVMLVLGLAASMLQTATQLREAAIPFLAKLAGLAALTCAAGPLLMSGVEHFAIRLIGSIPAILHG